MILKRPPGTSPLAWALGFAYTAEQFYRSLGEFVAAFAELEATTQETLWALADVGSPVAQAVFSGVKTDAALNLMKRIAEAQNWPPERREALSVISLQLGEINRLRNDILHFGASAVSFDSWLVSNRRFVHIADRIRETNVTPEILRDATADLETLEIHLIALAWRDRLPDRSWDEAFERLKQPWRYKPSATISASAKDPKAAS